MTRYSPQLVSSAACPSGASLSSACRFGVGTTTRSRSLAEPLLRFWHGLTQPRSQLPRLVLQDLGDDRLRDLGFLDGRNVQRRDPLRD